MVMEALGNLLESGKGGVWFVPAAEARADRDKLRRVKAYYKTHPVEFIQHWCDTYDPRAAMHGGRSRMPFVLFKRQIELVEFIYACLQAQTSALIEKSRDMGASPSPRIPMVWMFSRPLVRRTLSVQKSRSTASLAA